MLYLYLQGVKGILTLHRAEIINAQPHTNREKGMKQKDKEEKTKLTQEDIEKLRVRISLLELKRRVGSPKLSWKKR